MRSNISEIKNQNMIMQDCGTMGMCTVHSSCIHISAYYLVF